MHRREFLKNAAVAGSALGFVPIKEPVIPIKEPIVAFTLEELKVGPLKITRSIDKGCRRYYEVKEENNELTWRMQIMNAQHLLQVGIVKDSPDAYFDFKDPCRQFIGNSEFIGNSDCLRLGFPHRHDHIYTDKELELIARELVSRYKRAFLIRSKSYQVEKQIRQLIESDKTFQIVVI